MTRRSPARRPAAAADSPAEPGAGSSLSAGSPEALMQFLYQAPIGLVQLSPDGTVLLMNPMAAQLLMPLDPTGDLSNLFDTLVTAAPWLRGRAAASDNDEPMVCEDLRLPLPAQEGSVRRTLALNLMRLDAGTLMCCITDVTASVAQEQQRLAAHLHGATHTDNLTTLPNRTAAVERIERALARQVSSAGSVFGVLYINADRFEAVNLSQGHATGDALLRGMAARLEGLVRASDSVAKVTPGGHRGAARLGGDEFVVVLDPLRSADDLCAVAQRVVETLSRPYRIGDQWLHLGASVGAVLRDKPGGGPEDVLHEAALAMREAKRTGGARWALFEPALKSRAAQRGTLERELREAITEQQLFVVYQPILALDSGRCHAVEALVRWRHPLRGIVPPLDFIPLAEETGLIGALGLFVLNESCRQFAQWQATLGDSAPRMISVNLSRAQLADDRLVDQVRQALTQHGLPAGALELEVTESLAAQDETMQQRLHALRDLGVTLALDDFGTGYSSLACLHQLPVGVLKIDRSFVSKLETSAHHRVLVEATVRVAQSLGLDTVAEGIETLGQAAELRRLGCAHGQGYLFSRPLTADDTTRWLPVHAHEARPVDAAPTPA